MVRFTLSFIFLAGLLLCQTTQQMRYVKCSSAQIGGTADAITCTPNPARTAYTEDVVYILEPTAANTGAVTLNVSALGVRSVVKPVGTITAALVANDLKAGGKYFLIDDGSNLQVVSLLGNAGGSGSTMVRSMFFLIAARNAVAAANMSICGSTISNSTYPGVGVSALSFPDAAANSILCPFVLPTDWAGGSMAVKLIAHVGHASAQQFQLSAHVTCVADGGTLPTLSELNANSTAATVTSTAGTAAVSAWTISNIAVNSCAAGRMAWLMIQRDGAHASDTSTQPLPLSMADLRYTSNQ